MTFLKTTTFAVMIGATALLSASPAFAVREYKGNRNGQVYDDVGKCLQSNSVCSVVRMANPPVKGTKQLPESTGGGSTDGTRVCESGSSYMKPPCKDGWILVVL